MSRVINRIASGLGAMLAAWAIGVCCPALTVAADSGTVRPAVIKVVMDDHYPPYIFRDEQGQLKGILIDHWRLWEQKTGIRAEVTGMDWGEAQRRMQAGEFDVIDTIFRNEKREAIYDFTKPYARLDVPLFFHTGISGIRGPEDAKGFMVAAKTGDNAIDILRKHGVTGIIEYPSYEKLIAAARDGKVKVFTVDKPPAQYYLAKMGILDQFRMTAPMYSGEFHRAVLKGRSDLLATVENGFAAISAAEYKAIDNRWMGTPVGPDTLRYAWYSAAVVGTIGIVVFVWLVMLNQAVRHKTAELSEREEMLRLIMSSTVEAVYGIDDKGACTFANTSCLKLLGYQQIGELLGRNMHDLIHYGTADGRPLPPQDCHIFKAFREGVGVTISDECFFRSDGNPIPVEYSSYPIRKNDVIVGAVVVWRDISERRRLESELQQSQELFTLFMKHTPVYTFIKRIEGDQSRVIVASDNFIDMVGRPADELRGRTMFELFPEEFARKITDDDVAVVKDGTVVQLDEELNGRSYTTIKFPIIREGADNLLAGFTIDITERKHAENERDRLERKLLHTQKLESLGVLAGGIAHDFNNILMAIIGNADLALMRLNPESPVVENLHRIEQAASRAADLAKQMLAYSGKGKFVVEQLDLNRLLEEMLHMLEVSISKKAVLRLSLAKPLPSVEADATQLRQIVMNLVINASEAIGDKSGVIAITTGCMECDKSYLKDVWLDEQIGEGLYVYLEVADTGCGMDRETLGRIFDPFFTTKFTGRGLGMAAVMGIVRGHKGAIKVYSEPRKGTTFKVLLPASSRPAELTNHVRGDDDWQGSGRVLLVDDEETVRAIGSEMLQELGFEVITANDGREAIELFKADPDISCVILDLTMPHMDGEQCFRELRQVRPDIKVIISSGYNEQEVTQRFAGKGLAGFVQKPYKLFALKTAMRSSYGNGA